MRTLRSNALVLGALLGAALSSCSSGNEAGEFGGDLFVTSCSLGCTNGQGGQQVFCSIVNTFRNQEIAVEFTEPIDIFSVNASSFRVVDIENGTSPDGEFFQDPVSPRRLIFRPALTFDNLGNPVYGFEPNRAYQITIPGQDQGDNPPFVTSVSGRVNRSRNESVRVFPLSNWTEMDVWQYMKAEDIQLPSLYYAHERDVVIRNGTILAVSEFVQPRDGEKVEKRRIRFRTMGDATITGAVESDADTMDKIIEEVAAARQTERGNRADDKRSESSMEDRKKAGYF